MWTGTEMIIWGGTNYFYVNFNTGGRYNPGNRQLDRHQHDQCARCAVRVSHGSLDRQSK